MLRLGAPMLLLIALAACQGQQAGEQKEASAEPAESEQSQPGNDDNASDEGKKMTQDTPDRMALEEAVEAAREDLSERTGRALDEISVVRAQEVTWANGALGCPEEGMMYTQALVEGFYILLADADGEHAYHSGRDGQPFFCPPDRSKAPPKSDPEEPLS
ncbi:hypothetical protein DZC52_09160 [Wenzhouxiangella sediminis]|uniref:Uncharacterized protein n=1 Tax=Wenzhouxiangella sediminis TaxID=1792836 RepID=A0A3E1K8D5_9GAMM|nr:hypothetical protein DZC52_09160 [Wenzhouxiangella sediminis]